MHPVCSRRALVSVVVLTLVGMGCTTDPYTGERKVSRTAIGAGIGAGVGAGIGALAGDDDRGRGAAIGAGIGALAGGAVGAYMDHQEAELRRELQGTGVSVTRAGDELILNMPGNVTFAHNSYDIRGDFYPVLNSVAKVLKKFQKTIIEITGHTDSTGAEEYNQQLSERRAVSVAQYMESRQVQYQRILTEGYGEDYPIADNETAAGREQNRRVELRLVPLTTS